MRSSLAASVVVIALVMGGCAMDWSNTAGGLTPDRDAAQCVALASEIGQNLQVHQTGQFLVLSAADPASAAVTGEFLEQVYRRFYQQLGRAGFEPRTPRDKLVWVCLSSYGALEAYGRAADGAEVAWMNAYYSHRTNRVAAAIATGQPTGQARGRTAGSSGPLAASGDPGRGASAGLDVRTITHELTHQLAFNSGLQRRGATYPLWLTEGLATNFEADSPDAVGLGKPESRYRQRLMDARTGGRLIPLERFVGMSECPGGQGPATRDAYAQSWGLFHYLLSTRPAALKRYMADLASPWLPPQGEASLALRFIAAFGPIKPLEEDFGRFIEGRR